eukprot:313936_1
MHIVLLAILLQCLFIWRSSAIANGDYIHNKRTHNRLIRSYKQNVNNNQVFGAKQFQSGYENGDNEYYYYDGDMYNLYDYDDYLYDNDLQSELDYTISALQDDYNLNEYKQRYNQLKKLYHNYMFHYYQMRNLNHYDNSYLYSDVLRPNKNDDDDDDDDSQTSIQKIKDQAIKKTRKKFAMTQAKKTAKKNRKIVERKGATRRGRRRRNRG